MPSIPTYPRPGWSVIAAIAGALLAAGLALLAAGGWSQPADADDGELGTKVVKTFVGTAGESGFSGDGGPASDAELNNPFDMAVDATGNTYIADTFNKAVRKVDPSGIITTVASGDDGLGFPVGVAVDSDDNAYVLEFNGRVRKIDPSGAITTFADLGASASAGLAVDSADNLYIPDESNDRVVKVDPSGTMTTVAGTGEPGFSGDGGPATEAQLDRPNGIAVDGDDNLYISDRDNHRIRKVDPSGTITTVAGTGSAKSNGDGGAATNAAIGKPRALTVDSQSAVYIGSSPSGRRSRVRKVDSEGIISTIAGGGDSTGGFEEGIPPTEASLSPEGLFVEAELGLLIADTANSQVLQVTHVPDLVALPSLNVSANPATVGEEFTYTAKVVNPGLAGPAQGVTLTVALDDTEVVSMDPAQGTCSSSGGEVTCDIGELAEGEAAPVEIVGSPTVSKIAEHTAEVTADGDDPLPRNNAASVTSLVEDAGCGQVLTEGTTLEEDIGPCVGNGLIVGADGITVDLNGHTLIGWRGYAERFHADNFQKSSQQPDEPGLESLNTGRETGIVMVGTENATVQGGTVKGFAAGVLLANASNNTLQDLTVRDNVGLCGRCFSPLGDGIVLFESPDNVIADNHLVANGLYDNIGVLGGRSKNTEITGNTVEDGRPAPGGTRLAYGIAVQVADGTGRVITGSHIANNTVRGNAGIGIRSVNNFDARIANNLVVDNGVRTSTPDAEGEGIQVANGRERVTDDTNTTIVGNTVRNNGRDGILIKARGNKIINNTSTDNGQNLGGDDAGINWFDLRDATSDTCEFNTWNNNEWGSAGYTPECTSKTGLGPGRNPAADADPDEADDPTMRSRSAPSFDGIGQ